MRKFYVFLDFDGVMWDFGELKKDGVKSLINSLIGFKSSKQCLNALNSLIKALKKKYIPIVVISSERRRNFEKIKNNLINDGIIDCDFDTTELVMFKSRGKIIEEYLKSKGETENFVIVDDFVGSFKQFDKNKIIKTSLIKGGLSLDKVNKFLNLNTKEC